MSIGRPYPDAIKHVLWFECIWMANTCFRLIIRELCSLRSVPRRDTKVKRFTDNSLSA